MGNQYIKELTGIWEREGRLWAKEMTIFLETLHRKINGAGGALSENQTKKYRVQYRKLIKKGEIDCMEPARFLKRGIGCQIERSNSQILLDRLKEYEDHLLGFN